MCLTPPARPPTPFTLHPATLPALQVRSGFPAVASGEVPLLVLRWTRDTPEAVSGG